MFYYKIDEELSLKLVTRKDADEIFEMIDRGREHFRQWLGWVDASTDNTVTRNFIDMNLKKYANYEALDTAIVYQGKIVGKIGLNSINYANKTTYIGYMLDEAYQGKGIMTRATKAMVTLAFEEYDLHKVEIHVAEGNLKSRAIPERLGFQQEGIVRSNEWLYDHYVDHVIYGMLRKEWLEKAKNK
ncbi:GNAT family N-acetyltransferase [Lysinibacillus sp. 54212]|uniref:GNAT family N-acetyltransferase n=1 Tax=Lysinibacillus sp. 54212 TaxID=3119829 RepID=UPI002FC6277C